MKFKFFLICFFIITKFANANINMNIPILNDGKITSFNNFAKEMYNTIIKSNINISSSDWLSELMFDRDSAFNRKIFLIKNKNIISNLEIIYNNDNLYSLNDIYESMLNKLNLFLSLNIMKNYNRTKDQNEFVELYYNFLLTLKLGSVFELIIPKFLCINDKNNNEINYISEYELKNVLNKNQYILVKNSQNFLNVKFLYNILLKIDNFYVFPFKNKWVNLNDFSEEGCSELAHLSKIAKSFYNNNTCDKEIVLLEAYYLSFLTFNEKIKFKFERFYNSFPAIFLSFFIYLSSFLLILFSFIIKNEKFYNFGKTFFICGLFFHLFIIILRFFISFRAPVTNLFESILFVNFIISFLLFFLISKQNNNKLIFIFGLFFISFLQYIIYRYNIESGNIKNLLPVLNTNFWLTTHVITITIGYALCIIFSILGHVLIYIIFKYDENSVIVLKFFNLNLFFCILSVSFLILGTFLGGIWADQSWGRFWGWDPKENGALLIIIWQIFILHFRFTDISSFLLLSIFSILTNIIVSLSWFGVNLLNVGLHSYGFIENIGSNLLKFFLIEFVFILFFLFLILRKKNKIKKIEL